MSLVLAPALPARFDEKSRPPSRAARGRQEKQVKRQKSKGRKKSRCREFAALIVGAQMRRSGKRLKREGVAEDRPAFQKR
jgi:hypothetical protein